MKSSAKDRVRVVCDNADSSGRPSGAMYTIKSHPHRYIEHTQHRSQVTRTRSHGRLPCVSRSLTALVAQHMKRLPPGVLALYTKYKQNNIFWETRVGVCGRGAAGARACGDRSAAGADGEASRHTSGALTLRSQQRLACTQAASKTRSVSSVRSLSWVMA
ncbi:hypothetical protein EVAR_74783_1 [Eumeta japonica]|uniref:Uncharacterized protein n=1 Tax=Eumeta variegata TaxID=151549 RepID=A0A4C1SP55_EUMVA|nr:hypothetical protein EVAR_74783_1 [Eumeta japonica]